MTKNNLPLWIAIGILGAFTALTLAANAEVWLMRVTMPLRGGRVMVVQLQMWFEREEREVFAQAFNPIHRLEDYPGLCDGIPRWEKETGYDAAVRCSNALGGDPNGKDGYPADYLMWATYVLGTLQEVLNRDRDLYRQVMGGGKVTDSVRAVLLEARERQLVAILPALDILCDAHKLLLNLGATVRTWDQES